MEQYLQQFLNSLASERGYSENTVAAYRNDLTQFVRFLSEQRGGAVEPSEVTPEMVQAYVEKIQQPESGYAPLGGYAPSTVARKIAAVKSFFHALMEQGLIPTNPATNLSSPKIKKSAPKTISKDELERLLAAPHTGSSPKHLRDSALLELLAATGMRVTEATNLRLEDMDWEKAEVVCRGKEERNRRIPMGTARAALEAYLQTARPMLASEASSDYFFLNHRGRKLTRQGVWLIIKEAAEAAGIGVEVTPHTLRHSFAKSLVGTGESLRRVQELLGHANLSTTQVYKRISETPAAPVAEPVPVNPDEG
ncbi:MAG: tyrosine-type recombinase/integrase [Anaerolineales bacterium]|nr:tyrosine-type recombinase/integrase [Anaerolineales bacterium]